MKDDYLADLGYLVIWVAAVTNQFVELSTIFCRQFSKTRNNAFIQAHNWGEVEKRIHEGRFSRDSLQAETRPKVRFFSMIILQISLQV